MYRHWNFMLCIWYFYVVICLWMTLHLTEEATAVLSEAMTAMMSCEPLTYHGREALTCEFTLEKNTRKIYSTMSDQLLQKIGQRSDQTANYEHISSSLLSVKQWGPSVGKLMKISVHYKQITTQIHQTTVKKPSREWMLTERIFCCYRLYNKSYTLRWLKTSSSQLKVLRWAVFLYVIECMSWCFESINTLWPCRSTGLVFIIEWLQLLSALAGCWSRAYLWETLRLCDFSNQGSCSCCHVTGVSLHGQIRASCLCFVNRDYERAASRQVGVANHADSVTFPPPSVSPPICCSLLSPNKQNLLPTQSRLLLEIDACRTNTPEVGR